MHFEKEIPMHFEKEKNGEYIPCLSFGAGIIFLILAHSVYKK